MTLSEFIDMGGYGAYVWSAYAVTCVVLALNVIQSILRERKIRRTLKKRIQKTSAS